MNPLKLLFSKIISPICLWIWGWKIEGDFPHLDQMIIIVAPHRSAWDVPLGWFVQSIKPIPPKRFLVKKEEVDKPITGWILKKMGAFAIDREGKGREKYFAELKSLFEEGKRRSVVITPEGTRTPGAYWKRGFYQLSFDANMPVILAAFDYERKIVVIGPTLFLYGESDELERIRRWYENNVPGYKPNIIEEKFFGKK